MATKLERWESADGTVFDTEQECRAHEEALVLKKFLESKLSRYETRDDVLDVVFDHFQLIPRSVEVRSALAFYPVVGFEQEE